MSPDTHVITIGDLEITARHRLLRPWTWAIKARGTVMAEGVGSEGFVNSGWNVVERLNKDGFTKDAGLLREILVALEGSEQGNA